MQVLHKSYNPRASNVVLVKKNRQVPEAMYSQISDIPDQFGGNRFCTVLDMKSGYHQIELEQEHKERIAFKVGPLGIFFQYDRLPFGLCNAPTTYQQMM